MLQIPGPNGPISYERDSLGFPRVYARGREEAAFAQGWLHAEDRMVQVYLQVAIARGRLMQHAGERPAFRMLDRGFRRLHLERDAAIEAAAAPARTQMVVNAYCAGWNARAESRRKPWLLRVLRIRVEPMTPGLVVILLRAVSFLGLASMQHRAEEVVAEIAAAGISEKGLRTLLGDAASGADLAALAQVHIPDRGSFLGKPAGTGSSAWVVSPQRSATGAALLACDFHLEIGRIPPYLYLFDLELGADDYLMGVSLPGTPNILAGRNADLAWGATYAYGDTVDLLIERCRDERYLAAGEWRPLRRREELVRIRGRRSEHWVYYENEYGVLDGDATQPGDYLALRWTGAGGLGRESLDAVVGIEACRTAESGARHMAQGRTHSIHYVFADRDGHIAYSQSGAIDERPEGWSGAYPRPAWEAASRIPKPLPQEALPISVDPPEGLIVSANERVDGPGGEQLATLPHPPYRAARLRQLLNAIPKIDLPAMARAQYDTADLGAELLDVWRKHLPPGVEGEALVKWAALQGSSGPGAQNGSSSTRQMVLFHALHREVASELLGSLLGAGAARYFTEESELFLVFQHQIDRVLRLEEPDLLDETGLAALLNKAWPRALARVPGGIELPLRAKFKNAFFEGKLPSWLGLDSAEMDIPGSPHAPFQARLVKLAGLELVVGPVFHLLFDMGRPGGWYNFAGGASERKRGPGYAAGLEDWRVGRFFPLGAIEGDPPNVR